MVNHLPNCYSSSNHWFMSNNAVNHEVYNTNWVTSAFSLNVYPYVLLISVHISAVFFQFLNFQWLFQWDWITIYFSEELTCYNLLPFVIRASNGLSFVLACIHFTKDRWVGSVPTVDTKNDLIQSSCYLYIIIMWCEIFPLCSVVFFKDGMNTSFPVLKLFKSSHKKSNS